MEEPKDFQEDFVSKNLEFNVTTFVINNAQILTAPGMEDGLIQLTYHLTRWKNVLSKGKISRISWKQKTVKRTC